MVTKKGFYAMVALVIVLGAFVSLGGVKEAAGLGVSVNLNLGTPQTVVMGPGGVSFVPNQGLDVFFYSGYWWAMRDNHWYRSHDYNGNWREMDRRYVPGPVNHLYGVPDYRNVYGKHEGNHIPYGQWKKYGSRGSGDHGNHGMMQQDRGDSGDRGNHGNHEGKGGGEGKHGHGNH